jgi:Uncharacterized protein conserved in bacteria (DUF2252)
VRRRPPVELRRIRLPGTAPAFDLNDFDETLPGPFEYDVKRMAASFVVAGRNNGFARAAARDAALASVTAYREAMAGFAQMPTMDIWYAHVPEDQLVKLVQDAVAEVTKKEGRDAHDPLFLQVKEATASVLEGCLPRSRHRQHGERVVQGQRPMQAASDIFLGWTKGLDVNRHFYWRQLRDMKGSALVELMTPITLTYYGRLCEWTLARAHARSGDPVAMASYLGGDDMFDRSITEFSERYADQNERDYEDFVKAIQSGRLEAAEGV